MQLYPWFCGFSGDLLFRIAVDTLFMQLVKGMALSDIMFATTLSYVLNILLQIPILKLVERLGNTNSVRASTLTMLAAALTLTFGRGIMMTAIGMVLQQVSFSLKAMLNVMLENNLELLGREDEYIKYSTKKDTVYAVITTCISLVASLIFNLNHYLPMALSIFFCLLSCVLVYWMVDYAPPTSAAKDDRHTKQKGSLLSFPRPVLIALASYGVFAAIIETGQQNAKLFIQDELLQSFNDDNTALLIGGILLISRVARIAGNVFFYRIYARLQDRVGVMFSALLGAAFVLLMLGLALEFNLLLKFAVMTMGYVIILFIRDPNRLYIYNLMLKLVEKEKQQRVMLCLEYARQILALAMSVAFSSILVRYPMWLIIVCYIVLGALQLGIGGYLYLTIKATRRGVA